MLTKNIESYIKLHCHHCGRYWPADDEAGLCVVEYDMTEVTLPIHKVLELRLCDVDEKK